MDPDQAVTVGPKQVDIPTQDAVVHGVPFDNRSGGARPSERTHYERRELIEVTGRLVNATNNIPIDTTSSLRPENDGGDVGPATGTSPEMTVLCQGVSRSCLPPSAEVLATALDTTSQVPRFTGYDSRS